MGHKYINCEKNTSIHSHRVSILKERKKIGIYIVTFHFQNLSQFNAHIVPRQAVLFLFLARDDNSVKPTAVIQSGITEQVLMSCSAALRPQHVSHA